MRSVKTIVPILFAVFNLFSAQSSQAQNPLLIPDTLRGSLIQLNLQQGQVPFYSGAQTQTMGANGNILGPTLLLKKHQNVTLRVKNNLPDTTTMHWHGMHVAPENDGGPHITIPPGTTWSPAFEVLDQASTHWYHPHLHMRTNEQVQKGIAGFIIVRDSQEAALNLPRKYGIDDFPLVIQTKVFDSNNQIVTGKNALDTALMVNATLKPYLNAPAQIIRLRILNGSSERVYNLGFSNNISFHQIGSDGGLLSAPVGLSRLLLAPGERAEILVDLSAWKDQTVYLKNFGTQIPNAHYGAAQPGMGPGQTIPNYSLNPLNGKDFNILTLHVKAATSSPVTAIPQTLITHNPWTAAQANITRSLVFTSMNMGQGAINGPFVINGAHFDMDVINYQIPFNNIEIWELRNQTPIAHPFHIHNVAFYVLDINGNKPSASLAGRKDVVLVPGGNSVVRFITRFEDFYNDSLPYMYHCHMLTHEDDGMMGQYIVQSPCRIISTQPQNVAANPGHTATFSVKLSDSTGKSFQWESNLGFGFQELQNAGQYGGVQTARLTVSNLNAANNNQLFRCKVTGTCTETSQVATLLVGVASNLYHLEKPVAAVFPNPTNEKLYVQLLNPGIEAEIKVADCTGRIVLSARSSENETMLNVSALKPGLYWISLKQNTTLQTVRVMLR